MKKTLVLLSIALLLTALVPAVSHADSHAAMIYVVHAIPGTDLGLDPELAVDVAVNDACAIPNFKFMETVGPLPLEPGTYNIKIYLANEAAPCSGDPVIEADVPFMAGETALVTAHLTEEGGITASKFVVDTSAVANKKARFTFIHAAAAPAVDVQAFRKFGALDPMFMVPDMSNGDKMAVQVRPKSWHFSLGPAFSGVELTGKLFNLKLGQNFVLMAVGSLQFNTFTWLRWKINAK